MINSELKQRIILAEQDEAIQADRVRKAYEELQEQRKPVTELESEITFAEANAETWLRRETGDDYGYRVEAPIWRGRHLEEIAKLRDKLTALQTEIRPFEQEHVKQRNSLAKAE
jgi:phosphatidylserine/phosphatidylglycerophosphate/cardiolipin synthase-like enzyme